MKTSVERVDDTTVKLSVTVEAERVTEAMDAAAARIAGEVKIPGFRPGKAPRKVVETRVGKAAVQQEAVREALPQFYSEAAQTESLAVVGPPEFDVETFEDGQEAQFSATVEVRPEVALPEYDGLQVAHPEWEVTDEEVAEQLEGLRERFAELETVQRPAAVGDFAVVTVRGTRDGEAVDEASAEDILYQLRDPEETDAELDRRLVGAEAGQTVEFTDSLGEDYGDLAGQEVDFAVEVKEVKERRLPDLDDDFAVTASEFDTIEELRDALREQLAGQKLDWARAALRGKVVEAVCELVEVPLPKTMIDQEVRFRLSRILQQAEQYGMGFADYLEAVGSSQEQLLEQLEAEAGQTVKAQLVVDAVGESAGIDVTREDLGEEISRQASRLGRTPDEIAQVVNHPDRIGALVSDAFRRKAIDHLLDRVQVLSAPPEPEPEEAGETPAAEEA